MNASKMNATHIMQLYVLSSRTDTWMGSYEPKRTLQFFRECSGELYRGWRPTIQRPQ